MVSKGSQKPCNIPWETKTNLVLVAAKVGRRIVECSDAKVKEELAIATNLLPGYRSVFWRQVLKVSWSRVNLHKGCQRLMPVFIRGLACGVDDERFFKTPLLPTTPKEKDSVLRRTCFQRRWLILWTVPIQSYVIRRRLDRIWREATN